MDIVSKLTELKKLLDEGLLTQEEFDKFKSELLGIQSEDAKDTQEDDSTKNHSDNQVVSESTEQEKHSKDLKNEIEKDYAQKLNSIQTSHSYWRYILAIAFFIGGGFYIAYKLHFKEKWAQETTEKQNLDEDSHGTRFTYLTQPVDDLESYSVTGISNEHELYAYLDEVAVYWCSEWKKAQQFQNENRRFEEMLMVSRCIDAYTFGIYEGIIVLNDLPTHLGTKAREYFDKKVKSLGYNSNWNSERHKSDNKEESDSYNESYYNESSENDDYYNRQQEQAEYESSQAYYSSIEKDLDKKYFDQNGNEFGTVKIGDLFWMNVNLNVDRFRNGDPIPQAKSNEEWIKAGENKQPAWCYYNNDLSYGKKYGKLYNWYAINDPRGVAPLGWHVPNVKEWTQIEDFLGGAEVAGSKMKAKTGWEKNDNSSNESGFNGMPGGYRHNKGMFYDLKKWGYWWTSKEFNAEGSWLRYLHFENQKMYWAKYNNGNGYSIRCVKD
jgi:uncharacterized protein (TIGR02145 family)